MKAYLFVFAVWPAALLATATCIALSPPGTTQEGQIVLERAPFCDFFVVKSGHSYVFMSDRGGWVIALAGGNTVSGSLFVVGPREVWIDKRARLQVQIDGWVTNWTSAMRRFDEECDPNATNPFGSGADLAHAPALG
ncbi:hypothetical protein WDZ92_28680 [Nostoc sp. NIES-2111]